MLVISRLDGEEIILTIPTPEGEKQITLKLISARRGHARIGIQAPQEIVVMRRELLDTRPRESHP